MSTKATLVSASITREQKKEASRSPKWPAARNKFLKKNPACSACGCKETLQVHHIEPFHENPKLELDPTNFVVLCAINLCHLRIGHGGNWKYYNKQVQGISSEVLVGSLSKTAAAAKAKELRSKNDGDPTT